MAKFDPSLKWHTVETKHFLFHYHEGTEKAIDAFIVHAEEIHTNITQFFDWTPKEKTHVILNDQVDFTNGSARPYPYNLIEMNLTPPSDITGLEDFTNWQYLLFEHEYVHIVQLDMADNFPLHMRSILGRHWLLFPNQYFPKWFIEGIATYIETHETEGIGRGQSSYFRALMRNELTNGLRDLSKVNQPQLDWPGGITRYLYGVYFFSFLAEKYGEEKIQLFMHDYSRFPIPYFINTSFKKVFGKSLFDLWPEFDQHLRSEFADELVLKNFSGNDTKQLSQAGYKTGFSKLLPDGSMIYINDNKEKIKTLEKYDLVNKTSQTVFKSVAIGNSFDHHPKNGILIPLYDWVNSTRLVTDLYIIDIDTGKKRQITYEQRYIRAIWHSDGKHIIALKNNASTHQIDLLSIKGEFIKTLWVADATLIIGAMTISPNGLTLVASVFRPNRGWNLEQLDLLLLEWTPLTNSQLIEAHPTHIDDGKSIVYTAEYNGIYNIYKLSLLDHKISQLTDISTAAIFPQINETTNTLYYSGLTSNGFNLLSQPLNEISFQIKSIIEPVVKSKGKPKAKEIATATAPSSDQPLKHENKTLPPVYASTPYNGLKYLSPKWWEPLPLISGNNEQTLLGFVSGNHDPIQYHQYQMAMAYDIQKKEALWDVNYRYSRFTPDITLRSNKNIFYRPTQSQEERGTSLTVTVPFKKINKNRYLFTTLKRLNIQLKPRSSSIYLPQTYNTDLITFGFLQNTTSKPPLAVSQHSGSNIEVSYELNRLARPIKSYSKLILNAAYYSPIFWRTVLELGVTAIGAGSQSNTLYLYGDENQLFSGGIAGRTTYGFSGYKQADLQGTNLQKITANLHIPLAYPQRSSMIPPIGISRIKFRPFYQMARIGSYSNISEQTWRKSIGGEIEINSNFGYGVFPFNIKVGVAKGLDDGGELTRYFSLIQQFL